MNRPHVEASAIIDAQAEEVYSIFADYCNGHPSIVPQESLRNLEIEAGGFGAGTIIRYRVRAFGMERPGRAVVSEQEPGRVLVEAETTSTIVTTFTVLPTADGQKAHVTIATEWEPAHTLREKIEQSMYPFSMRRMFTKELQLLADFIKRKHSAKSDLEAHII